MLTYKSGSLRDQLQEGDIQWCNDADGYDVNYAALENAMCDTLQEYRGYSGWDGRPLRIVITKAGMCGCNDDWDKIEELIDSVWYDQEVIVFEKE